MLKGSTAMLPQRFSSDQAIPGQIRRWQLENPHTEGIDVPEAALEADNLHGSTAQALLNWVANHQTASSTTCANGPKNNTPNKGLQAANALKAARIAQEHKARSLRQGSCWDTDPQYCSQSPVQLCTNVYHSLWLFHASTLRALKKVYPNSKRVHWYMLYVVF